ncbi:MAG TPA: DUF2877 domain-containing protein [Burkholderiales bacterium]|nr:DUF2877 domain-containing protein [Burkholderiales bacterium]
MSAVTGLRQARTLEVLRAGELARAALERSGGIATALPAPAGGPYYRAAGELLWVGPHLPAMHPRAVVTAQARPPGALLRLGSLPAGGWTAELFEPQDAARLCSGAGGLRQALARDDATRGYGALLAGRSPDFPLSLGVDRVRALAAAYANGDPEGAHAASRPLLGFGTGLTPSGDDLVGAALFGRRLLAPRDARWAALAEALALEVVARSHPVSAALFGDLVRGRSFAPLHAAAQALAAGDHAGALAAARALGAIGHSSGWDMLTGFMLGLGVALPD